MSCQKILNANEDNFIEKVPNTILENTEIKQLPKGMDYVDCIYYINLEQRTDRNTHFLKEIEKMNFDKNKIHRFNAFKHDKGYIGCAMSHIGVLKDAIKNNYKHILVFEDDFEFIINKDVFNNKINWFFDNYNDYNICLLSYNLIGFNKINSEIIEINNAFCASGYLLNHKFMLTLLNCFENALIDLNNNLPQWQAAIDVKWKQLQGKNKKFYGFASKMGIQMSSYSDIEKKCVNYGC